MDTNKTKIIIFYASYGGGHLNAAKSIESYLKSTYPNFEVELIDCMKYVNIGIEKITTLQSLGLSNTNLDDNKTSNTSKSYRKQ